MPERASGKSWVVKQFFKKLKLAEEPHQNSIGNALKEEEEKAEAATISTAAFTTTDEVFSVPPAKLLT